MIDDMDERREDMNEPCSFKGCDRAAHVVAKFYVSHDDSTKITAEYVAACKVHMQNMVKVMQDIATIDNVPDTFGGFDDA